MKYLIASDARKGFYKLIDEVADSHEPAFIKGKRNTGVLISMQDWEDIEETLLVASNKKLSEMIIQGLNTDFDECIADSELSKRE